MVELFIATYLSVLVAAFFYFRKKFDLVSIPPLTIVYMLAELPFLLVAYYNPKVLYSVSYSWVSDFDGVVLQHLILRFIFLACFFFVLLITRPFPRPSKVSFQMKVKKHHLFIVFGLVLFFYLSFLSQVGGIEVLLYNMSNKTETIKGSAFFRLLFVYNSFLFCSLMMCYLANKNTLSVKCFCIITLCIVFFMLASYGERKNAVVLLILAFVCWHIWINEIKLSSKKVMFFSAFLILFSALAPPLRQDGAFLKYSSEPFMLLNDMLPYLGELFRRFSDLDISIFIFSYFNNESKFLFLDTLSNFFTGFIPSSFLTQKPPMDEGVLIYNLAHYINPGLESDLSSYIPVGWPLSRYTSGWVHFGYFGVVLFSLLTSYVLILINNITFKYSTLYLLPIYVTTVVSGFGISNAYVFNLLVAFCVIFVTYVIVSFTDIVLQRLSTKSKEHYVS